MIMKRLSQKGSVLIFSLVMLVVLTLLALSSTYDTVMQERMAGNMRNHYIAFEAAEAALRAGEDVVMSYSTKPVASDSASEGVYLITSLDPRNSSVLPWWFEADDSFWNNKATSYTVNLPVGIDASNNSIMLPVMPQYIIEDKRVVQDSLSVGTGGDSGTHYYQITARGFGIDGRGQVILQAEIGRKF